MQLPSEFKCAGNTIKVKLVEKTDNDNSYSEAQSQVYANFLCEYFKSVASDGEFA